MSELAEKLAEYGIDYPDAMSRLDGNAAFYKRLSLKYLDNSSFATLAAAMEVGDFDAGYKAAHTLKGVAGNLSFSRMYKAASAICEALRQGEYRAAEGLMPELAQAHSSVMHALTAWSAGDIN